MKTGFHILIHERLSRLNLILFALNLNFHLYRLHLAAMEHAVRHQNARLPSFLLLPAQSNTPLVCTVLRWEKISLVAPSSERETVGYLADKQRMQPSALTGTLERVASYGTAPPAPAKV
jgi:hypothetical protein